jgi:hypothetical protein
MAKKMRRKGRNFYLQIVFYSGVPGKREVGKGLATFGCRAFA